MRLNCEVVISPRPAEAKAETIDTHHEFFFGGGGRKVEEEDSDITLFGNFLC